MRYWFFLILSGAFLPSCYASGNEQGMPNLSVGTSIGGGSSSGTFESRPSYPARPPRNPFSGLLNSTPMPEYRVPVSCAEETQKEREMRYAKEEQRRQAAEKQREERYAATHRSSVEEQQARWAEYEQRQRESERLRATLRDRQVAREDRVRQEERDKAEQDRREALERQAGGFSEAEIARYKVGIQSTLNEASPDKANWYQLY